MFVNDKTIPGPDPDQLFADGLVYLHTAQWILAYPVFMHLYRSKKEKSVSLLYNMALCHIFAKEHAKAIEVLEEALIHVTVPAVLFQHVGHLPEELSIQEYQSNHYYLALSGTAVLLNTKLIKLRIRRLMVDLHLELLNWEEVIRLASLPDMEKCKNVIEALTIATQNKNTKMI
jgi:hypothetical protein